MPTDVQRVIYLGIVATFLTVAAILDYRTFKIKNVLTVTMAVLGIVVRLAIESDRWAASKDMLAGFAVGFGILFVLWITAGGGAGDVKLMGAAGIWLGPVLMIVLFIGSAATVALIEMIRFMSRLFVGKGGQAEKILSRTTSGKQRRRLSLPYAVPLSIVGWMLFAVKLWKLA